LIERASKEIDKALHAHRFGLAVERFNVKAATVYEVSATAQFAELQLQLVFKFQTRFVVDTPTRPQGFQLGGKVFGGYAPALGVPFGWTEPPNYLANVNRLFHPEPVEPTALPEPLVSGSVSNSKRIATSRSSQPGLSVSLGRQSCAPRSQIAPVLQRRAIPGAL
jgi:hypothetical protein